MSHPRAATIFNEDVSRVEWHDAALWFVRQRRDVAVQSVPERESLRDAASRIRDHVLSRLDEYLAEFESRAQANGVHVHWARDADEHNRIVLDILRKARISRIVKSKSMLTEECRLNDFLTAAGIEVVDTDLGERIVQLAGESPSHIVMPAIHLRKEEIGDLFHRTLGTDAGESDPSYLTEVARQHLRQRFLEAEAAVTGVNFAVAETGALVVCTNEGNADLGVHLAPMHIASMGIDKVVARASDLGILLRLLARSATGQPVTVYTSHFHRPREDSELHVVIVDNGRSDLLGRPEFRDALKCIRCGACMNTCPVYRRSGGHSYGYVVPGPIGSILSPGRDPARYGPLSLASTLCGSCSDVCPVRIDIHGQLYRWRQEIAEGGFVSRRKKWTAFVAGWLLGRPTAYRAAGRLARFLIRRLPRFVLYNGRNVWGRARELPEAPTQSFRDWYRSNRQKP